MKPSKYFLLLCIVVLSLQLSCNKSTEPEETSPAPIIAIYPSAYILSLPESDRAPFDFTKTATTLHSIILPYNCPVSFVIANVGPEGSILNYSIADDGALGGFLTFTNNQGSTNTGHPNIPVTGSLNANSAVTITVSVGPEFTDTSFGGLVGSTLVLSINTPKASNYIKTPVAVYISNYNDEVQKLCGIWSGTWSGLSYQGKKDAPVNGTWELNLQSVDWAHQTATGTLTWNGSDAYWNYVGNDADLNSSVPHYYIVNRTLIFNNFNAELSSNGPCDHISLHIAGNKAPYPEELHIVVDPYGPDFHLDLSNDFKSILPGFVTGWSSRWDDPNMYGHFGYSSGLLYGSKSK
jgi:hypothetical protein